MIRHFNYTGRQKIYRSDAKIVLRGDAAGVMRFDATLALDEYKLPADAKVFVEAYRGTTWRRFQFGAVGDLAAPADRRLPEFGSSEGVQFRVKVVTAKVDDERPARILAQADSISPSEAEDGEARSLLALDSSEDFDEVWRLDINEDTGSSTLFVNKRMTPDFRSFARRPEFQSLILPEIIRRMLTKLMAQDTAFADLRVDNGPWGKWLRFIESVPGVNPAPEQRDDREEWVDDAVSAFARLRRIGEQFSAFWEEGEE